MGQRIVIMGVSGCGKSTVGAALAQRLGLPFLDGDDYHPESNRRKMAAGVPLDGLDRGPWLERLGVLLEEHPGGCVLACSALRKAYRDRLRSRGASRFVHLHGDPGLLRERLAERAAEGRHFMPPEMLGSQLAELEDTAGEVDVLAVDFGHTSDSLVEGILVSLAADERDDAHD